MSAAPNLSPAPFQTSKSVKFKPADNNRRVIAFLIDGIIAGALQGALVFFIGAAIPALRPFAGLCAFAIVASVYWTLLTIEFGATPGKKVMGLKIVRADQGLKLGFGQILLRETIGRFLSALPICLGYVWVSFDSKERKAFHDMVAKTRVVDYR